MAILKMKKLSLIVAQEDKDRVIKDLMWLNCVEVIPYSQDISADTTTISDSENSETKYRINKITSALDTIAKYRKKKRLFSAPDELSRESFEKISDKAGKTYETVDKILDTKDIQAKLKNRVNTLSSQIYQLEPWKSFDLSLDKSHTERCSIICGTIPVSYTEEKLSGAEDSEKFYVEEISFDREQRYICVYCLKRDTDAVLKSLAAMNFSKVIFPRTDTTASEIIKSIKEEITRLEKEIENHENALREYAGSAGELEELYDFENSRLNMSDTVGMSFSTATTCMIRGWIPEEKVPKLEKKLKNYTCYLELEDPKEEDKPPVELKNNKFASAFEGLIGLYSYPDYYGYDPLKYMSVFYCIIFGMMLADFVYGLILLAGCLAAIKLMKPKKTMKAFLQMFAWSGASTAICGLLFGSIMGDLPSAFNANMLGGSTFGTALWFDPTKNPMALLYVSFALGAIHLLWGMGLKAYMLFRNGKWVDAVCDIFTWYLVFLGVGILAAGALLSLPMVFEIGKWAAIAGVASLILTQGRAEKNIIMKLLKGIMSLYDVVNYVSDLLSYSRILALGLATAVVSSVINIMATLAGPSVMGFIMFVLILAVGHMLNIALNVLGSFVHASRLQYIEFFGKFYEDGGRHFAPLNVGTKHTRINTEEK